MIALLSIMQRPVPEQFLFIDIAEILIIWPFRRGNTLSGLEL